MVHRLVLAVAFFPWLMAPREVLAADRRLTPEVAPRIIALLADPGFETPLPGGYALDSIAIGADTVTCTLHKGGLPAGRLLLRPRAAAPAGGLTSASFAIELQPIAGDPAALALLQRAAASVQARDAADLYAQFSLAPQLLVAFGLLLAWALLLLARKRLRRERWEFHFAARPHHILPALLQVVIFGYWAQYWLPVRAHMLLDVPLQLTFAVVFEALWSLTARRAWEVGFGTLPIVLSTNLFIWFPPDWLWLGFVVPAVAIASKSLLRWRDGRHIFNPSALGIALVGLLAVTGSGVRYQDIALQLQLPPNMLELVFLLVLVPQWRFATAGLSLAAVVAMLAIQASLPPELHLPTPLRPAWFLAATLFAGDPMTIPRSVFGRVLHGVALGAGISGFAWLLVRLTGLDYFAKVFPVVLANLAVPLFERAGLWLDRRLLRAQGMPPPTGRPERWLRLGPAVLWLLVFVTQRTPAQKAATFDAGTFAQLGAVGVRTPQPGQSQCDANPAWCSVFGRRASSP